MTITSPDISNLDYKVLFDVSKAQPEIVLTNLSTVINVAALDWWFVITTPSGSTIHNGNGTTPDIDNAAFTTKTYTTWPMPMGQIEWGIYSVKVFVRDSLGAEFNLEKKATIIRPVGSTTTSKNNFGVASVIADMRCDEANLYVEDTTNYTWNGLVPTFPERRFQVLYPLDATDVQPPDFIVDDTNNALVPISFSGSGYQLVRRATAEYDEKDNVFVRIKYKYTKKFDVQCDADLCPLMCEYQNMVEATEGGSCNPEASSKLVTINALINMALVAKQQPLCGIKVGPIIEQIKQLGNFDCDCTGGGINGSANNSNGGSSGGGCCPQLVNIVQRGTALPPVPCPKPYFPATVWSVSGSTQLGIANDVDEIVSILMADKSSGGWGTRGIWGSSGHCQVVLWPFPSSRINQQAQTAIQVTSLTTAQGNCVNNQQAYILELFAYCGGSQATAFSYPYNAYVYYDWINAFVVGDLIANVSSYSDLLTKLNNAPNKPSNISYSASSPGVETEVIVTDTDCSAGTSMNLAVATTDEVWYGVGGFGQGLTSGLWAIDPKQKTDIGVVCGTKFDDAPWHGRRVGDKIYYVDCYAGAVNKVDITYPMFPNLNLKVRLTNTVGAKVAFGADPLYNNDPSQRSLSDVYFHTDLESPVSGYLYIVEASTGFIWKYDITTDTEVSVDQDDSLIGQCPRAIVNGNLYFSKDGDRELALPASSTTSRDAIIELDLSTLGTGTLVMNKLTGIVASGDEPWAITLNAHRNELYISTKNGDLVVYNAALGSVVATYTGAWGLPANMAGLANSCLFRERLYLSTFNSGTFWLDSADFTKAAVAFDPLVNGAAVNVKHWNFNIAPGACYGLVTYEQATGPGTTGGAAMYDLDGRLIHNIVFAAAANMYNAIPVLGIPSVTPNNLCS